MSEIKMLQSEAGRKLAYVKTDGAGPTVVFLGGFKSDMTGTKAQHLERWAQRQCKAFLRFDYSGHGQSSGDFDAGSIGEWAADARAVIEHATDGPIVLVGSSMGGWISLLLARQMDRIVGLVGIAAAPDFTEDGFWAGFSSEERRLLEQDGFVDVPSDYGEPYRITRHLIENGRRNLVLRQPLSLPFPVRLLQGTEDTSVTRETALRLLDHIDAGDLRLTFARSKDHSFSDPDCLAMIEAALEDLLPG